MSTLRHIRRAAEAELRKKAVAKLPRMDELRSDEIIYPWLVGNLRRVHLADFTQRDGAVGHDLRSLTLADVLPSRPYPYLISRELVDARASTSDAAMGLIKVADNRMSLPHEVVWLESPRYYLPAPGLSIIVHGQLIAEELRAPVQLEQAVGYRHYYFVLASVDFDGERCLVASDCNHSGFAAPFADFLLGLGRHRTFRSPAPAEAEDQQGDSDRPAAPHRMLTPATNRPPLVYIVGEHGDPGHILSRSGPRTQWVPSSEVMGHWRKVDGIGKNRRGEYIVAGKTWITEHVRRYHEGAPDPEPRVRFIRK